MSNAQQKSQLVPERGRGSQTLPATASDQEKERQRPKESKTRLLGVRKQILGLLSDKELSRHTIVASYGWGSAEIAKVRVLPYSEALGKVSCWRSTEMALAQKQLLFPANDHV